MSQYVLTNIPARARPERVYTRHEHAQWLDIHVWLTHGVIAITHAQASATDGMKRAAYVGLVEEGERAACLLQEGLRLKRPQLECGRSSLALVPGRRRAPLPRRKLPFALMRRATLIFFVQTREED